MSKSITKLILTIIRLYQRTFSPDHGFLSHRFPYGYCRFYPTCSEYSHEAIRKHGIISGMWMGTKRVVRCNPFNRGGYDPVIKK